MPSSAAATASLPLADKIARAQALALDILCQVMQQTEPGDGGAPVPTRDARLAAAAVLRLPRHLLQTDSADATAPSTAPKAPPDPAPPASSTRREPLAPPAHHAHHQRTTTTTTTPSPPVSPLDRTPQPLLRATNKPAPAAALLARAGAVPVTTPTPRAPPSAA